MDNIGIIVQARTSSTRFPNKVFADINGSTNIELVLKNCLKVKQAKTILAIPHSDLNAFSYLKTIPSFSKEENLFLFAGAEKNVLSRFYEASKHYNLDTIIRITGDCPCIEPEIINSMIDFYQTNSEFDYCSNMTTTHATTAQDAHNHTSDTMLSDGFSVEIFSFKALERAYNNNRDDYEREHVTSWIKNNLHCGLYDKGFLYLHGKFSLDEEKDIEVIEAYNLLRDKGFIYYGKFK